jgi:hypothetical protein
VVVGSDLGLGREPELLVEILDLPSGRGRPSL